VTERAYIVIFPGERALLRTGTPVEAAEPDAEGHDPIEFHEASSCRSIISYHKQPSGEITVRAILSDGRKVGC
jgi:hypothetical protein